MNQGLFFLAVATGVAGTLAGGEELLPLTVSARSAWVENHSRTSDPATAKDAASHEIAASTDLVRQLTAHWQFIGEGSLAWETVPTFDALDTWRLGVRGEWRRKFGLGPFVPVGSIHGAATKSWIDEEGRSGWQLQAGTALSKRFSSSWRGTLGVEATRYYARHAPFDLRQDRWFADIAWDVTDRWQAQAGVARIDGHITANAAGAVYHAALAGAFGPAIAGYYSSIPWHVTHTYGLNWVAYRVDARVNQWWAALAPAIGESTSLPLRYERAEVTNKVGVRYVSEFWSLALLHRF